mgnify:CR=1 FL=1
MESIFKGGAAMVIPETLLQNFNLVPFLDFESFFFSSNGGAGNEQSDAASVETASSSELDDEVQRLFNVYDIMNDQENKTDESKM